jgi:hypothetical protein
MMLKLNDTAKLMNKFTTAFMGATSCFMAGCCVFLTVSGYPVQGGAIAAAIPVVNYTVAKSIDNREDRDN